MKNEKYSQRLQALESAIKEREAIKAAHAPFVLFQPWDMLNDQYNVRFYPEGKYQKPQRYERISYTEALKILNSYPDSLWCQISMGECVEWLFVFHYKDGRHGYTGEQMDWLTKMYISEHPKLEELLSTEDGKQMMETLSRIPQVARIKLKDMKTELSNC